MGEGGGGAWVAGGYAWWGGMCGGVCAWQGACMVGGACVVEGVLHGRGAGTVEGHAWQGACVVGGMRGRGRGMHSKGTCVAGGTCVTDTMRYGQ